MPTLSKQIGRKGASACQLCDWNNTKRYENGHVPRAVTRIDNTRICAKHLQLLHAIATAAGVSTHDLPPLSEVA